MSTNRPEVRIIRDLSQITPSAWNTLNTSQCPFLTHEFLHALELNDCVGKKFGWLPHYLLAWQKNLLIGALPLYLKDNSYGEFVFDYAWADAYQQSTIPYYPKFVAALPYTPVSSQRILCDDSQPQAVLDQIRQTLFNRSLAISHEYGVSSLHFHFPVQEEIAVLQTAEMFQRMDVQFHWHNQNYESFEHFLQFLTSSKRKKIKRDRRLVVDAGIKIKIIHGHEMTPALINQASLFYRDTFDRKWGVPTFNEGFFKQICLSMGQQLVFFFACRNNIAVACAICYRNDKTLYGRHWGCSESINGLHFELCYHQGIEYCINHGLQTFEPGAQGEHKISRGFLPVKTWSTHWIAHPGYRAAIKNHSQHETEAVENYYTELQAHSPYK